MTIAELEQLALIAHRTGNKELSNLVLKWVKIGSYGIKYNSGIVAEIEQLLERGQ